MYTSNTATAPRPGETLRPRLRGKRVARADETFARERDGHRDEENGLVIARFLSMDMQPIVDLRTGRVDRVQALPRLHLGGGIVQVANEFLPELNLDQLDALFRHEVLEAVTWLRRWEDDDLPLSLSITIGSSTLLAPHFVRWLSTTLDRFAVTRNRLALQLVETGGVRIAATRAIITELSELGFSIDLDDLGAGSGASAIASLSDLPFRTVKVDGGLFDRLHDMPLQTIGLLAAAAQLATDFRRDVVAQGLGSDAMLEIVSILGFAFGQGLGLGAAMPAADVAAWVRGFRATPAGGTIRSLSGALAYHVKVSRGSAAGPADLASCPLTAFLEDHAGQGAIVHERLHAAGDDRHEHGEALTEWLVAQLTAAPRGRRAADATQTASEADSRLRSTPRHRAHS